MRAYQGQSMKLASIRDQRQVLAGNSSLPEGFWQVWKENEVFLLALCRHWAQGNDGEARDLLGAAMLHSFERLGSLKKDIGNPRAWLATVVRHFCIDQHRKKSRNPEFASGHDKMLQLMDQQMGQFSASAEGEWIRHERYDQLLWQMNGLPARLRDPLILRACQNMSYKEIANHLQISSENARKRVETARKWLQAGKYGQAPENAMDEQMAAEHVLKTASRLSNGRFQYALPLHICRKDGRTLELPLLLPRRPQRLAQKIASLRQYQEKHPGGWKKAHELGLLLLAQGDLPAAKRSLEHAWQKQTQALPILSAYLQVLAFLGEWDEFERAAMALAESGEDHVLATFSMGLLCAFRGDASRLLHWDHDLRFPWLILLLKKLENKEMLAETLNPHLQRRPMCRAGHLLQLLLAEDWQAALPVADLALRRFPRDPFAQASLILLAAWRGRMSQEEILNKLAELEQMASGTWLAFSVKLGVLLADQAEVAEIELAKYRQAHPEQIQAQILSLESKAEFWRSWKSCWSLP